MTDINSVVLIGRLTQDIDERNFGYLPTGTAKANVSIAVNSSHKKGEEWVNEASFFDIVIFGKMAEGLKPHLVKGKQIAVTGKLKQDRWKDQNGNNKSRIYIIAESIQLLGGKNDNENNTEKSNAFVPAAEESFSTSSEDYPEDILF